MNEGGMKQARIYQKPKNAMQSGRAGTQLWRLEFEATEAKRADPLMGWAGSSDTLNQLGLSFATLEAAKAYAEQNDIAYHIVLPPVRVLKLQTYADNFK